METFEEHMNKDLIFNEARELIREVKFSVRCLNWHIEGNYEPGIDFEKWRIEQYQKDLKNLCLITY